MIPDESGKNDCHDCGNKWRGDKRDYSGCSSAASRRGCSPRAQAGRSRTSPGHHLCTTARSFTMLGLMRRTQPGRWWSCRNHKFCTGFPTRILNTLVGAEIRCKMSVSYPNRWRAQTSPLGFDPSDAVGHGLCLGIRRSDQPRRAAVRRRRRLPEARPSRPDHRRRWSARADRNARAASCRRIRCGTARAAAAAGSPRR